MRENKRGQFFLLAAVIISVVVISLGTLSNRVVIQDSFLDIEELNFEVQRETGEVLNYEIYKSSSGDVEKFSELMAEEISDKYPETEFVFIFGSVEGINVTNFGSEEIGVVAGEVEDDDKVYS